jgi:membrane glycosyltransferase
MDASDTSSINAAAAHQRAAMTPPEHLGEMHAVPWLGMRRGLWRALLSLFSGGRQASALSEPAWREASRRRRGALLALIAGSTLLATLSYVMLSGLAETARPLQLVGLGLFVMLFAWVSAGFWTACMGWWVLRRGDPHAISISALGDQPISASARTALIMPICNEDVDTVFAGLDATWRSLRATGQDAAFDLFVLSDTFKPELQALEVQACERLRAAFGTDRVFYRCRTDRHQRKAGNVAEFCRRWGRNYRYMIVLDADSIMSGQALLAMVRAMEARPNAGIIQTPTRTTGAQTLHARAQQFAARVVGPVFNAGMQYWQLGESHYFGHNAILRIEPFMGHCGLATLPGSSALAGEIMSHDFVEAALMRRAGYEIWMLPPMDGSYEQNPPDLSSELQRDRRWCHGNLQNLRLIAEPGLAPAHRAMLGTGAMSYLSAPLWLLFVAVGLVDAIDVADDGIAGALSAGGTMLWLWGSVMAMLMLPRLMGIHAIVRNGGAQAFGGGVQMAMGALIEAGLSMLQAPLRMFAHSLFVIAPLIGLRLEWTSPPRVAAGIGWRAAVKHQGLAGLVAGLALANLATVDAEVALWLVPMVMPLALAVPLSVLTSRTALGLWLQRQGVMLVPEERHTPAVLRQVQPLGAALPMAPVWQAAGPILR